MAKDLPIDDTVRERMPRLEAAGNRNDFRVEIDYRY